MADDALDIALGLWRVPALRATLRARPLPDDVGTLVELASGMPLQLRNAARRSGETEARLLEAARFYVREVLVFHGADAWRVLGTPPGASVHVLKSHHRWLQHWLHPDRSRAAGDAVHAARVNAAWAQLRTAERRAAYSADVAEHGADEADRRGTQRIVMTGWRAVPGQAAHPRRHWIGIGAVGLACSGLFGLVLRKANEPPPDWPAGPMAAPAAPDAERPLRSLGASGDRRPGPPVPRQWGAIATRAAARETAAVPAREVPRASVSTETAGKPPLPALPGRPPSGAVVQPAARRLPDRVRAAVPARASAAPWREAGLPSAHSPVRPEDAAAADRTDLQRATLAQRRGIEVTQYLLATSPHVPPIWHSGDALDEAAAIRERVGTGHGDGRNPARFATPRWSIDRERAVMTADIVGAGPGASRGTLQVELAWHHEMWLVDRIQVVGL